MTSTFKLDREKLGMSVQIGINFIRYGKRLFKKLAKDPVYIPGIYNYFIHQLINQRDLQTIGNAVSYIDKITEESIPTLLIVTCMFATPMPLKIKIEALPDKQKPDSHTLQFEKVSGE